MMVMIIVNFLSRLMKLKN